MFIQIKTQHEDTREQSAVHINAAQIGTIQFGEEDTVATLSVGPDVFTTIDPDSIKALRSLIGSRRVSQSDIDWAGRILAYQAQDAALSARR